MTKTPSEGCLMEEMEKGLDSFLWQSYAEMTRTCGIEEEKRHDAGWPPSLPPEEVSETLKGAALLRQHSSCSEVENNSL